jgi:uncharacterized protein involved in cysteine biosynthesis
MLGKPTRGAEYAPFSFKQIAELIACLPLNLIPVVGPPAFIVITGTRVGKLSHHRWYKLRGLGRKDIKLETKSRSWEYIWFGTVAMVLELIPVLSFFFLLTTAAGSALWVAKMEMKNEEQASEEQQDPGAAAARRETSGSICVHDDPV